MVVFEVKHEIGEKVFVAELDEVYEAVVKAIKLCGEKYEVSYHGNVLSKGMSYYTVGYTF